MCAYFFQNDHEFEATKLTMKLEKMFINYFWGEYYRDS